MKFIQAHQIAKKTQQEAQDSLPGWALGERMVQPGAGGGDRDARRTRSKKSSSGEADPMRLHAGHAASGGRRTVCVRWAWLASSAGAPRGFHARCRKGSVGGAARRNSVWRAAARAGPAGARARAPAMATSQLQLLAAEVGPCAPQSRAYLRRANVEEGCRCGYATVGPPFSSRCQITLGWTKRPSVQTARRRGYARNWEAKHAAA